MQGDRGEWAEESERPWTSGGSHTYRYSHAHENTCRHTHKAPPLLCIFICGYPLYMITRFLSPYPTGQPLHVLPYCLNWFCTIPLKCSPRHMFTEVPGNESTFIYVQLTSTHPLHSFATDCQWKLGSWHRITTSFMGKNNFQWHASFTCYLCIVAHSVNTHVLDSTTQNNSPKPDELSWKLKPEEFMPINKNRGLECCS